MRTDEPTLFDVADAVRTDDPATSHEATEQVTHSGRQLSDCEQIVMYLIERSVYETERGLTFGEIAYNMGRPADPVWKRMKDCRHLNPWTMNGCRWIFEVGPKRKCRKRGTKCHTYYVRPDETQL